MTLASLQIERMLAERRLGQGDKFTLREFHDYVSSNGNVPLSLQRWELLGLDDDAKRWTNWRSESGSFLNRSPGGPPPRITAPALPPSPAPSASSS
jgi:hypothetical protein